MKKKRNLFLQCLSLSFLFHFVLVLFLWSYPFIADKIRVSFFTHLIDPTNLTTLASKLDFSEKNQILQQVFEEIVIAHPPSLEKEPLVYHFEPKEENVSSGELLNKFYPPLQLHPFVEEKEKGFSLNTRPSGEMALKEESVHISPPPKVNPTSSLAWVEELKVEVSKLPGDSFDSEETPIASPFIPQPEEKEFIPKPTSGPFIAHLPEIPQGIPTVEEKVSQVGPSPSLHIASLPSPGAKKGIKQKKLKNIALAPTLDEINDISWEGHFQIELAHLPQKEKGEYLFSVTLKANKDQYFEKIPQHFYFLIDRSHSVSKFRFQTFCNATIRALPYLKEKDTFNIILFDTKIKVLSENNLEWNKTNLQRAKLFLKSQEAGGFFSSTDLVEVFNFLLNRVEKKEGAHTAILLSDGDVSHSLKSQINSIKEFTEINGGEICLYTAIVGGENNSAVMELLATFNRGGFLHSQTHAAFPRKLAKLIKTLDYPIAQEISLSAISHDPELKIQFYPPLENLPHLYLDQPYTIYGIANRPSDFTLFVQGKAKEKWVTLKKQISLEDTPLGNERLEQEIVSKKAYEFYKKYLSSRDSVFLKKASDLLKSHSLQVTIE